ncbi:unnamed protein product [Brassica napus]|uniref:(rape) hypothetical protein n=1 Tax=Brassica napus TaxID=3708 RepID=A0A816J4N0_BRANA|nr:unnamed protein product [Brassica napus]
MAFNRDLKLKKPIVEDYSYSLEEAFNKGKNETRDRYRAMIFMYQNQLEAITAKHDEEREVYHVQGKLELLKELFKKDARRKEKNKLKTELVLAKEKMDGVKIPYVDWFKMDEPQILCVVSATNIGIYLLVLQTSLITCYFQ